MVINDTFNHMGLLGAGRIMDKLGEFKNQLYNFMTNVSKEKPSNDKLDRMLKLMGQMEDVLYEIKKPTVAELRKNTRDVILRLRAEDKRNNEEVTEKKP